MNGGKRITMKFILSGLVGLLYVATVCCASNIEPLDIENSWKVFDTEHHPKAGGLHMTIRYPPHWTYREGRQPQAVQTFRGEDHNKGVAYAVLLIGQDTIPGFNLQADSLDKELLEDLAQAHGGKVIDTGYTTIDGIPAVWAVTRSSTRSSGIHLDMKSLMYVIIYNRVWIQFHGSVGGRRGDTTVDSRFAGYRPMLDQMAASIELPGQRLSSDDVIDKSSQIVNSFLKWYYAHSAATQLDAASEYFDMNAVYNDLNRRHNLARRSRFSREEITGILYTAFFNPLRDVEYSITSVDVDLRPDNTTIYKYRVTVNAKRYVMPEDFKRQIRNLFSSRRDASRVLAQQFPHAPARHLQTAGSTIAYFESLGRSIINVDSHIHHHFIVDNNTGRIRDWIRPELGSHSTFDDKAALVLQVSPR
jgi:hypothetical protein